MLAAAKQYPRALSSHNALTFDVEFLSKVVFTVQASAMNMIRVCFVRFYSFNIISYLYVICSLKDYFQLKTRFLKCLQVIDYRVVGLTVFKF